MEFARKIFHIASGTIISLLYYYGIIGQIHLLILLAIGIILYFAYKHYKIPIIHQLVLAMERKENMKQAGLASILFLLGCTMTISLYSKEIATASILILAWGDSIAHIIGVHGRLPYINPKKTWEGIIAGIITGTIAAQFFVKWWISLIGTATAMLLEGLDLRIFGWKIDDNLLIPILSGLILTLLG